MRDRAPALVATAALTALVLTACAAPAQEEPDAGAQLAAFLTDPSGGTETGSDETGPEGSEGLPDGTGARVTSPADPAPADPAPADPVPVDPATLWDVDIRPASLDGLASAVAAESSLTPVRLIIPDLGIDMPIGPVGVAGDGQMEIPDDVDDVGWYEHGPKPGERAGTAVLASHVDSWAEGAGPFAHLRYGAAVGMRVNVMSADGRVRSFRIADNRMIPKPQMPLDLVFDRDGPPRLILVTCGGRFQRDVGRYTDNIVVTAVPVEA